jgi:DnaJ-class molecular chaperone
MQTTCNECRGKGTVIDKKDQCPECQGKKVVPDTKVIEVHIPRGAEPGFQISYYGEGEQEVGLIFT